jgi:hypothetical protein
MQLPENTFFDILRSYLGNIKTPFNKQRLVDDLAAFLSRQEIQRRIAALLDETDRRCLLAVAMIPSATLQDLAIFFEGDYSFADLYGFILNLEERLLLFKIINEGRPRINLNPVLEPILKPILQEPSLLFPTWPLETQPNGSTEADNTSQTASTITPELLLGALLAWLSNSGQVFKSDGSFKKKAQEELERIFAQAGGESVASDLIHALEYLGILSIEEGIHHIDEDRLEAFASLDPGDRREYLAAALLAVELELDHTSRRLSRERLQSWTRLIHRILQYMHERWVYSEQSLRRFWLIEEKHSGEHRRFGERESSSLSGLAHCPGVEPIDYFKALVKAMEKGCLIVPVANGYIRCSLPHGQEFDSGQINHAEQKSPVYGTKPFIVCDASFSIIVYPEIPFIDLCRLGLLCRLQELGQTLKLELFQDGFIRALDRGFRLDDLKNLLETLSTKPIPQSLAWSLEEWERRYHAAALYKGMVLVLAPERRFIAEIDAVKDLIERELAPGVYLLRTVQESLLSEILEKAGLDTLARPEPSRQEPFRAEPSRQEQSRQEQFRAEQAQYASSLSEPYRKGSRRPDESSAQRTGSGVSSVNPVVARINPFARRIGRARLEEDAPIPILSAATASPAAPAAQPELSTLQASAHRGGQVSVTAPASQGEPLRAAAPGDYATQLLQELHAKLEAKAFTKEQKDELSARIDRRLILDECQLVAAAVRYEKLEARGLDYVGKVRLVEQALSQGALVELFWRGPKGEANRAIVRPLGLEKTGTELMLRGEYYPEGEVFNLHIGKISLVRRLKRSIFGE